MTEHHIASAFDRDLENIQALIMQMGGLVEAAIADTGGALTKLDLPLAERVRNGDAEIDALEEKVNGETTRVIALRAPTAGDLRTVMTVFKISGNLERCGDYAKNVAKRTQTLAELDQLPPTTGAIARMLTEVGGMLRDALDAYMREDDELARSVILRDEEVDMMYNSVFRELLTFMMEDPRNITGAMHLHFIAKNVERIGDHVTSIAEQTVYLVTGAMPDDNRPKSDRTAFVGEA
jgi:phosphate transport system protein